MGRLLARDREVLNELCACHDSRYPMEWARPLDCGGSNGSDHSYRLSKMAKAGLVEARQRSAFGTRGAKVYRITDAGRAALAAANGAAA